MMIHRCGVITEASHGSKALFSSSDHLEALSKEGDPLEGFAADGGI